MSKNTPAVDVAAVMSNVIGTESSTGVVIDTVLPNDKIRLNMTGGKFRPIVEFIAVAVVDDVLCLIGHDVEYDKTRVTAIDAVEFFEIKSRRYVRVSRDLFAVATIDPISTRADDAPVADADA